MAGSDSPALAAEVSRAGGLGSLAGALLAPQKLRDSAQAMRAITSRPFNLNFFCHSMTPAVDPAQQERWKQALRQHYERLELDIENVSPAPLRLPFNAAVCDEVEEVKPAVVSFHFGLPEPSLMQRLKERNIRIIASATSVAEARWLERRGCDAIIAQGSEAGGHRGMFLERDAATQTGLMSLLPQVVSAVSLPVKPPAESWTDEASPRRLRWSFRRATRHGLPVLPRSECVAALPQSPRRKRR